MKKNRAPDLTQEHIVTVLDTLDTWRGKLTWDLLLDKLEAVWGHRYSRFTLASYAEVANAFAHRKDALRGTLPVSRGTPTDERVRAAMGQAGRLHAERLFDVRAVVAAHLEIYRALAEAS